MNRRFKLSKGFTLIELLVVILILAILAALIVPRVVGQTDKAKVGAAQSDIAAMRGMLNRFKLDTGRFPTTDEGLISLREQPGDVTGWQGPYSEQNIPLDPWGNEYIYEYPGPDGDDSFLLMSHGSDGAPGGENFAADIISGQ